MTLKNAIEIAQEMIGALYIKARRDFKHNEQVKKIFEDRAEATQKLIDELKASRERVGELEKKLADMKLDPVILTRLTMLGE